MPGPMKVKSPNNTSKWQMGFNPAFKGLNGVWWSKNITRNRKKMIYNGMVKSVLIYGAETYNLYEDDRRRINATEMDALRRLARICKLDRKTNEYIRAKMDAQDVILDDITRNTTYLVWSCRENEPNTTTKNYNLLES
jgi:ribonuclease HII